MLNIKTLGALLLTSLLLPALSSTAMAGDRDFNTAAGAVIGASIGHNSGGRDGAIVGGVLGAVVGNSLSNNDRGGYYETRSYQQAPVYYEQPPVYYSAPQRYYAPPVVYVEQERPYYRYYRGGRDDYYRDERRGHGYGHGHGRGHGRDRDRD